MICFFVCTNNINTSIEFCVRLDSTHHSIIDLQAHDSVVRVLFDFIGFYYWKQWFRTLAWGSVCSNPYWFEFTGFLPESNWGPADNPNLSSPTLFSTELWWRIHHQRSFRTLTQYPAILSCVKNNDSKYSNPFSEGWKTEGYSVLFLVPFSFLSFYLFLILHFSFSFCHFTSVCFPSFSDGFDGCALCQNRRFSGEFKLLPSTGSSQNNQLNSNAIISPKCRST